MVYISSRAVDTACEAAPLSAIEKCQQEAKTPYCWPANGSRICYPSGGIQVYWPPAYYNEGSAISLLATINTMGDLHTYEEAFASTGWSSTYLNLGNISSHPERRIVNITLRENYRINGSPSTLVYHQGPILSLIDRPTQSATSSSTSRIRLGTQTSTPTVTPSPTPSSTETFTPGEIAGIGTGSFVALVVLTALAYAYCARCCLACCHPGKAERRRVRAAERRRVALERVYAQRAVDANKAAVARGEIWQGSVRPGDMWVSRSDWPAAPAARLQERREESDDEIRAVSPEGNGDRDGERWMEEQRRELERIEVQRREERRSDEQRLDEQRVEERREEIMRTEEDPPAYEAPPPKYTP